MSRTATLMPTLAPLTLNAGAPDAYPVNYLCRAWTEAPVFSNRTGEWMYSIPAGDDMRVTFISANADPAGRDIFFGHGADQGNGYSYSNYFSSCRPG